MKPFILAIEPAPIPQNNRTEANPFIENHSSKESASGFFHEGLLSATFLTRSRAILSSCSGVISAIFLASARVNFPNHSRISFSSSHGVFSSTFFVSVSIS